MHWKAFLITGMFLGINRGFLLIFWISAFNLVSRNGSFPFLSAFIGWNVIRTESGALVRPFIVSIGYTARYNHGISFVLTAGLSGYGFLRLRQSHFKFGARDMASGFYEYVVLLVLLCIRGKLCSSPCSFKTGPAEGGFGLFIPPLSALEQAIPGSGLM